MGEPGTGCAHLSKDREQGWSTLHHGIDPAGVPLLRGWLRGIHLLARPFRGVPPTVITVVGVLLALDALLVAARYPWVALAAVLLATLCDALDGAVAVLADRATRIGAVADRIGDRVADSAFALVIWRCGAPLWLALLAGALSLAHESIREVLGGTRRARITVAERPTRVVCSALACVSAGVSSQTWPPTLCAGVWVGLAFVGLVQLCRS